MLVKGNNGSVVFVFGFCKCICYLVDLICRDGEEVTRKNEHPAPVLHADFVNQMPYYCARFYFSQVLYC